MNNQTIDVHAVDAGHSSNGVMININNKPPVKRVKDRYTTIETINDDCIRYVFDYLDANAAANLGSTCARMLEFAYDCKALEKYQEVEILMDHYRSLVKNEMTSLKTITSLESEITCFGLFVRHLTWTGCSSAMEVEHCTIRSFTKIIKMFPNLETLRIRDIKLINYNVEVLKSIKTNLEILELRCDGITDDWSGPMKRLSNLNRFELHGPPGARNGFSLINFYPHFNSLTSLTLSLQEKDNISEDVLEKLLIDNGHCMQHLILFLPKKSESIGRFISKLPKLKTLEVDFLTTSLVDSLSELNHLKSLKCRANNQNCHSLLQKLSDCGIIEFLEITAGSFETEDDKAPPLTFKELKTLRIGYFSKRSGFFELLTISEMPAISTLGLNLFCENWSNILVNENALLKLLRSKVTIKFLSLYYQIIQADFDKYEFISRIIDVLKEPSTPSRPILNLLIPYDMGNEGVRKKYLPAKHF